MNTKNATISFIEKKIKYDNKRGKAKRKQRKTSSFLPAWNSLEIETHAREKKKKIKKFYFHISPHDTQQLTARIQFYHIVLLSIYQIKYIYRKKGLSQHMRDGKNNKSSIYVLKKIDFFSVSNKIGDRQHNEVNKFFIRSM